MLALNLAKGGRATAAIGFQDIGEADFHADVVAIANCRQQTLAVKALLALGEKTLPRKIAPFASLLRRLAIGGDTPG